MTISLAILATFVAGFALIVKRLSSTILTAPMIFLGLGMSLSASGFFCWKRLRATCTWSPQPRLFFFCFFDAAQVDPGALRRDHVWSSRVLAVGLPLAVIFGTLAAWLFLPGRPLCALALVASILAPKDTALGQTVVSNDRVSVNSRRTLILGSDLNYGLALPAVLLPTSLAAQGIDRENIDWLFCSAPNNWA